MQDFHQINVIFHFFYDDIAQQKQNFGINTVPSAVERSALQANL